jgi:hypothetical protein
MVTPFVRLLPCVLTPIPRANPTATITQMADKPIAVDIEVATDDLCSVYGCDFCPGFAKSDNGEYVFCVHECHEVDNQTCN